jgi:hypothetical protein
MDMPRSLFRQAVRSPDVWRWAAVAVGIVIRLVHVLRDPPLWHDEAALVLNSVYLDLSECFGKLLHHEAAPPLFLAMERLTLLASGDSERALRAPVLVIGCLSLVVFALLARRVLPAWPAALAVVLFAGSDRLIWHATEAKPYAVDVLVAALFAWGYVRMRDWPLRSQCLVWLVVLPVAEWLSFPACFVAGGLLLALLPMAIRATWWDRLAFGSLGIAVVGSFVALALGPAKAQQDGAMTGSWVGHFADWSHPVGVPVWAAVSTMEVLRYALMPLGQVLVPVAIIGVVRIARRDPALLTVLLAPLGLALLAALLGKYPYGGARVCVFAAPALLLLVAEGTPACWGWLRRWSWVATVPLVVALALPVAHSAYRVVVPWPRADFREAVDYVESQFRGGDLIASDHWEVLYYTRGREERVCQPNEIGERRPARVWVLTGTDPGVGEVRFRQVPPDWQRMGERRFHGTVAVLYEYRPIPAASTSAGGAVP